MSENIAIEALIACNSMAIAKVDNSEGALS